MMDVACSMHQRDEECMRNLKRDRHRCKDNVMCRMDLVDKVLGYCIEDG
jgi:hypothetical protein